MSPGGSKSGDWTRRGAAFVRASILANRWFVWRLGTSLALAYVAAGRIAAYVSFVPLPPLHNAAGCLLASEAGATVTDIAGRAWTLDSKSIMAAATAELHRDLLRLVAESCEPVTT